MAIFRSVARHDASPTRDSASIAAMRTCFGPRSAAAKKAKADGKKGKEARAAVNAAVNITAEQKKALSEVNKARQAITKAAHCQLGVKVVFMNRSC